jgi:aspartate racemase
MRKGGLTMKTIGMIGGTSWESTQLYYQYMNTLTAQTLGGLHSAKCILYSLEFGEVYAQMERGDWDAAAEITAQAAKALENAGADFLILCANTSHKFCGAIE